MKLNVKAEVTNNYYIIQNKTLVAKYCESLENGSILDITFAPFKKRVFKSYDQLKMIHALLKVIAHDQSITPDEAKIDVKEKLGLWEYRESKILGKAIKEYKSFASLKMDGMTKVIEQTLGIVEWLGIDLPPTDDLKNLYNYVDSL